MRRYTLGVQDREFTIDIVELSANRFAVTVDGEPYEVALTGDEDLPGAVISPTVAPNGRPPAAPVGSRPAPVAPSVAPAPPAPAAPAPAGLGETIRAPIPGVVLEVLVTAGDAVARGDPLAVLEAMKMRNLIRAPRDGQIVEVSVQPGQPIGLGDPIVRIGADGG